MNLKRFSFYFICILLCSCANKSYTEEQKAYIDTQAKPPLEYLHSKLTKHDIVLLGEMHGQKQTLDFIKNSLASLNRDQGVTVFATEFLQSEFQEDIDKLVVAPEFNREELVELYRHLPWVWGYREYLDIIEEIWRINQSSDRRIRIIAMDILWQNEEGRPRSIERQRDALMFHNFMKNYQAGEKAIIHTGFNHSFLDYKLAGNDRLGNRLKREYQSKVFQVAMHHQMSLTDYSQQEGTYLPRTMDELYSSNRKPFGVDIVNSPFASLRDDITFFFHDQNDIVFEDVTKGYIVVASFKEIRNTTWITGFVGESNFIRAKNIARTRDWFEFDDDISLDAFNLKMDAYMGG